MERQDTRLSLSRRYVLCGAAAVVGARSIPVFADIDTPDGASYLPLKAGEMGRVGYVVDGDVFKFKTDDASQLSVKLASIEAPQSALRAQNRAAWPFSRQARAALSGLISGRDVQLFYGGSKRDRYERALAQVYTLTPDGAPDLWVQEEMVRLGLARVFTWPDETVDSGRLYRAERQARIAGRGIWSHDFYGVRNPDPNNLAQYVDSAQIVEGIILSTAQVRGRIYMNFGVDYKTDFTAVIAKKNVKRFTKAGLDPLGLEGARVRVRGWIELVNGPAIWLGHPQRLEILS